MKQFEIPSFYRSPIISKVKLKRKTEDPRKKDFSPTVLDFGPLQLSLLDILASVMALRMR